MSNQTPRPSRSFINPAWVQIFLGIVSLAGVYFFNNSLVELETGAVESVRLHWMIALVYNAIGRIPTLLLMGAVALLLIVSGVRRLVMERKN